jgi:hypothetical protein
MSTDPRFLLQRKPGFPVLRKAEQHIPTNPSKGTKRICCSLDGVLAHNRDTHGDIGLPLPGSMEFLQTCVDSAMRVTIVTNRPVATVSHWLQRHSQGLERHVHISALQPPTDVFLSAHGVLFTGAFPTAEELILFTPWWEQEQQ